MVKLAFACQKQYGYASIGSEIPSILADMRLEKIRDYTHECYLTTPQEKRIMSLALRELSPTLLKYQLIDNEALKTLNASLEQLCQSNAIIRYFDTIQTVGILPQ